MNLELKLLAQPFDTDFSYHDRTSRALIFLVFCVMGIFTLIPFESGLFKGIRIILIVAAVVFIIQKIDFKKEDELLTPNIIGTLNFDGESISFNTSENTIVVDKNYQGLIQFKFEGYKGEVEGYGRHANVYYGTNNIIELSGIDFPMKYYVFLNGTVDKRKFSALIKWCYDEGINYKEFTRGEATYFGKKLNYKEIQAFKTRNNNN